MVKANLINSPTQSIEDLNAFLNLADLQSVQEALKNEGVTKLMHIIDVTAEDLTDIGMYYVKQHLFIAKHLVRSW